ncbi:hypothetical protein [Mucilaginibacter ginsenosidivorax]|uniref:Uncharacterized protein n=1 Tax=Mucilaginibacter ginsenosidivorax TaxID=862126 RepID=A0A5B8VZR2_9SPHI|nr:hypothetical protein [Mucilaginibacter ginsenosidivorax]QEC76145.1 hypothetical protein FSB76_09395 [Mucilaginibacter ginsenosidivorax]
MKKCLLSFFCAALLLLSSCAKKSCCVVPVTPDFIIADKNGVKWEIQPAASNILGDTTTIAGTQTQGGEEETFSIKLSIGGVGYYPLKNHQGYYLLKKNGAITKKYALSPTHLNSVSVISVNQADMIIQGFFDLKFIKTYDSQPGAGADSVSFLDGKFKVTLHN